MPVSIDRTLPELLYKLTGVVGLFIALSMIPEAASVFSLDFAASSVFPVNRSLMYAGHIVPIVLLILGSLALIFSAARIARSTGSDSQGSTGSMSAAEVHSMLLSTAGVVILGIAISSIPRVVHNFAVLFTPSAEHLQAGNLSRDRVWTWAWSLGVLLQAGLGILLVVRGSSFATFIRRRFDRAATVVADGRCPHCGWWYEARQYKPDAAVWLCGNCKQELPRKEIAKPVEV